MFVRLLVLLISNVLYCFSVLVCCRSLVRIMVQRGGIKQRWNFSLCRCVRTQKPRSNVLPPSAREVHVALASPIIHRFNLAPWVVICIRTHLVRSNATPTLERTRYCIATKAECTSRRADACASAFEHTTCV
jgi:hypothetical protein